MRRNRSMADRWRPHSIAAITSLLPAAALVAAGCSKGPARVSPPSIDANTAAANAMAAYDRDGDGVISGRDLDAAPAIRAAMETLDANKDGGVQETEIVQRIESWQANHAGITTASCTVTLDGRPLPGASIVFEPEAFLGDEVKAAFGETSPLGVTMPTIPKADRPTPDTPAGIQYGFYRVRISKKNGGQETLPAKYNTESILGQQVAGDDPAMIRQDLRFDLKSK